MQPKIHEKVWGFEAWIANTPQYCGKRLVLNKGWRCSMHHHKQKDETFYVSHGTVLFETASPDFSSTRQQTLTAGTSLHVEPGTWHRFSGITDAELFEFSTHHEDADSYRKEPSGQVPSHILQLAGV